MRHDELNWLLQFLNEFLERSRNHEWVMLRRKRCSIGERGQGGLRRFRKCSARFPNQRFHRNPKVDKGIRQIIDVRERDVTAIYQIIQVRK
jgi:hypothetical protein